MHWLKRCWTTEQHDNQGISESIDDHHLQLPLIRKASVSMEEMAHKTSMCDCSQRILCDKSPSPIQSTKFLNGIRGLAALMVLGQHARLTTFWGGQPGVDLFFILSSYLLTFILYGKMLKLVASEFKVKEWVNLVVVYSIRRVMRVYPLFMAVAIYLAMIHPKDRDATWGTGTGTYDLVKVLSFTPGYRYHIFWTLPLELWYYFVIPPFCLVAAILGKWRWLPLALLALWCVHHGLTTKHYDHQNIWPHFSTFLTGSIFGIVYIETKGKHFQGFLTSASSRLIPSGVKLVRWSWDILGYVTFVWIFSIITGKIGYSWVMKDPFADWGGNRYFAVLAAFLFWKECLWPSSIARLFEWNFLCFCGKICYPIYLLHSFPVYLWNTQQDPWDRFYFSLLATLALAALAHYLIEKPLMKCTEWLCKRIQA